ncbi:hypothetical protein ACFV0R_30515 [Streptomyces sp. NPDC059578]|uniref:hypothetical protein n=1 Tax=Streptomyces sp. NPDC059578 TaxID=3346874 RepID=UPI0036857CA9
MGETGRKPSAPGAPQASPGETPEGLPRPPGAVTAQACGERALPLARGAVAGCDLVTVPARQGLEAVDILRRAAAESVGPVLHDNRCRMLGFLVPPGTADGWDVPGSACTRTTGRAAPPAAPTPDAPPPALDAPACTADTPPEPPVVDVGWLLPPGAAHRVTDPAVLREALDQAARMIEAADNCC